MSLPPALVADLRSGRLALFAGAGLSAVLGLPSWAGLIAKMAEDLDFDPELFEMLGSYPILAEYYLLAKNDKTALASWMAREWHGGHIDVSKSATHRAIVEAGFPLIYTTNYDHWIERAYDAMRAKFTKVVFGYEIRPLHSAGTEIIKFHGDIDEPQTMVLTESDYFERTRFEAELDIRLRADLLQFSFLFIGYSVSDMNIRNMLYRLSLFRKEHRGRGASPPRSYIFLDRQNEVQAALLAEWGIDAIFSESLDSRDGLEKFMSELAVIARP